MTPLTEAITNFVAVCFMLAAVGYIALISIEKMERADCYKWQHYEEQYPLYETHPDTAYRCLALGVDVHDDY